MFEFSNLAQHEDEHPQQPAHHVQSQEHPQCQQVPLPEDVDCQDRTPPWKNEMETFLVSTISDITEQTLSVI